MGGKKRKVRLERKYKAIEFVSNAEGSHGEGIFVRAGNQGVKPAQPFPVPHGGPLAAVGVTAVLLTGFGALQH